MLIPIGDVAPRRRFPWINYLLIAANLAAFAYYAIARGDEYAAIVEVHGLVPARWRLLQFFTSMFLHAGIPHLLGNMLFLWIAGDNVEDRMGHLGYLLFYLLGGAVAGVTHTIVTTGWERAIPCIGASGAVSGVIGAYLVFFPRSKVKFLVWLALPLGTFLVPSWLAILAWVAIQGWMAWRHLEGAPLSVAVWAHLGGFVFGFGTALLFRLLRKK